jgi:hypothetical protein
MLVIGGQERTEAEYRDLLERAGLRLTRVVPSAGLRLTRVVPSAGLRLTRVVPSAGPHSLVEAVAA